MKVKVYNQIEAEKLAERARKEASYRAIEMCNILSTWAIWDVLQPTPEKMQEVLNFMHEKAHYIQNGEISVPDMAKMLLDETGIKMHFDDSYFGKADERWKDEDYERQRN